MYIQPLAPQPVHHPYPSCGRHPQSASVGDGSVLDAVGGRSRGRHGAESASILPARARAQTGTCPLERPRKRYQDQSKKQTQRSSRRTIYRSIWSPPTATGLNVDGSRAVHPQPDDGARSLALRRPGPYGRRPRGHTVSPAAAACAKRHGPDRVARPSEKLTEKRRRGARATV